MAREEWAPPGSPRLRGGKPRGRKSRRRRCGKAIEACRPVARSRHQEAAGSRARQPFKERRGRHGSVQEARLHGRRNRNPGVQKGCSSHRGPGPALTSQTLGLWLRIALRFERGAAGTALVTVRLDDREPPITHRREDEARPQLSLAAGAAGNGDLALATSPPPVSGGFGSARRVHAVAPTAIAPTSANVRCHSSAGTPSCARPRVA